MSADFTDTQLEILTQRWAEDPSPHLALRLANVYRQRGQLEEALPILEQGLEARPNHVSIQVALGRYRLEAGDPFGAAQVLRSVVDRDPGHLVANKLLVNAHLGLGDRKSAADRLELYSLLNDTDPDLEALRAAVANASVDSGPPPLPASFGSAEGPGTDLASLEPPGHRAVIGALDREPFAVPEGAPGALPDFFPRARRVASLEGEAETVAQMENGSPASSETADAEAEPPAWAAPSPAAEPDGSEAEEEPAEAGEEPAEVEEVAAGAPAPDEIDAGAGATSTLGALYLAQGHVDEARRTFERVLDRDPDDAEARAGLEEIARRQEAPVESVEASDVPPNPKVERLMRYLGRIRAAAARLQA